MSFSALGLRPELLQAISAQGYDTPTPIQAQAIPAVLQGRDLMAAAQTGTGKTAGFTLPMLQLLASGERAQANCIRALVLTPTRELAAQVQESVHNYGAQLPLRSAAVFGGVSINPQMMALRRGVDILVATPGRLMDLYNQRAVKFNQVQMLVLDEADRMLDMGFIHDIKKILALLPRQRQSLLFSATFSDEIRTLASGLLRDPMSIDVSPRNATASTVKQSLYMIDKARKTVLLAQLIHDNRWDQVLVFVQMKHMANRIAEKLLAAGISAAAIHGNKSQGARTRALADFKANEVRVLVATDIAARGLDIEALPHVINYELPMVAADYVHRIGRTGRAGSEGEAISLISDDEKPLLSAIEKLIKKKLERLPLPELRLATPAGHTPHPAQDHHPHERAPRGIAAQKSATSRSATQNVHASPTRAPAHANTNLNTDSGAPMRNDAPRPQRMSALQIPAHELEWQAIRAQGPGGQNVNKVSNAMQLRFNIQASSLDDVVKARLLNMADDRITREGVIVIKAQSFRSQEQNREDALQRLCALIARAGFTPKKRKPTKPTAGSVDRRLQHKAQASRTKAMRGKPPTD